MLKVAGQLYRYEFDLSLIHIFLLYKYIGLTGSAYVAIPCVAPIALGGFYSFNGMNFYEYMGKKPVSYTHLCYRIGTGNVVYCAYVK